MKSSKIQILLPVLFALIFMLITGYVSIMRYYTFAELFDLAIFDQIFWKLSGNLDMYSTLRGMHRLGDHFDLFIFIILPFYFVWKSPVVLIISQVVGAGLSVIPLFLISRKVLKCELLTFLICVGYITYPALLKVTWYPFHPETMAILFILCAFYALLEKKYTFYFIFFFLALSCKEDISITLAALSIYIFFKENKKVGLLGLLMSIAWFITATNLVIPHFAGGNIWYMDKFAPYGSSISEIIKNIIFHPQVFKTIFFAYKIKLKYILALYGPVAFLGIFSPSTLLLSFPQLVENLLSCSPGQWFIDTQYTSMIIPFIFISTIYGMKNLINFFSKTPENAKKNTIIKVIALIYTATIILTQVFLNPFSKERLAVTPHVKASHDILKLIPLKNSISTNSYYLPHLSKREKILLYPNPFIPCFMMANAHEEPDYILLDASRIDYMIMYNLAKKDVGEIKDIAGFYNYLMILALKNKNYKIVKFQDGIILLKRKGPYN